MKRLLYSAGASFALCLLLAGCLPDAGAPPTAPKVIRPTEVREFLEATGLLGHLDERSFLFMYKDHVDVRYLAKLKLSRAKLDALLARPPFLHETWTPVNLLENLPGVPEWRPEDLKEVSCASGRLKDGMSFRVVVDESQAKSPLVYMELF